MGYDGGISVNLRNGWIHLLVGFEENFEDITRSGFDLMLFELASPIYIESLKKVKPTQMA